MTMRDKSVSATELATLGRCERQLVLDAVYGKVAARSNQAARDRGDREHLRHHMEVQRYAQKPMAAGDRRCFIATVIYGPDAPQTWALRAWRDRCLLPSPTGRLLVRLYYAISPLVARLAMRQAALHRLFRFVLDRVVRWIS